MILQCLREVGPEFCGLILKCHVLPKPVVVTAAVLLRPAAPGQAKGRDHHLQPRPLGAVQNLPQQGQIFGDQTGIGIGIADQEIAILALPFAEGQPHPTGTGPCQRVEIGLVGRRGIEAVAT